MVGCKLSTSYTPTHFLYSICHYYFRSVFLSNIFQLLFRKVLLPVSYRRAKTQKFVNRTDQLLFAPQLLSFFEKLIFEEKSTKCNHGGNHFGFREDLGVQNAHATFLAILDRYRMLEKTTSVIRYTLKPKIYSAKPNKGCRNTSRCPCNVDLVFP